MLGLGWSPKRYAKIRNVTDYKFLFAIRILSPKNKNTITRKWRLGDFRRMNMYRPFSDRKVNLRIYKENQRLYKERNSCCIVSVFMEAINDKEEQTRQYVEPAFSYYHKGFFFISSVDSFNFWFLKYTSVHCFPCRTTPSKVFDVGRMVKFFSEASFTAFGQITFKAISNADST